MSKIEFRHAKIQRAWNVRHVEVRGPVVGLSKSESEQRLKIYWASVRHALGRSGFNLEHSRQTLTSLTCKLPCPKPDPAMAKDFADMTEKEFSAMLATIFDLGELEGIANRRKILNAPQLKRYSQWQRDLIIQRKWEILHG
jgi:hypothetical protein